MKWDDINNVWNLYMLMHLNFRPSQSIQLSGSQNDIGIRRYKKVYKPKMPQSP